MLVSTLLFTVALGTMAVSARAVERSGSSNSPAQQPLDASPNHQTTPLPLQDGHSASHPQTCKFAPSLPLPTTFTSTLPSSLYNHLPSILNSHFISPFSLSSPTAPLITTLSLADETGDASLQGIYLGLVYTSHTFALHSSAPVSPPTSSTSGEQAQPTPQSHPISDLDKAWGSPRTGAGMEKNENPSPSPKKQKENARQAAKLQCKQRRQEKQMKKCFSEAVDGVKERKLVEGTLEYPGEGRKMRFLVWRVD
ncbi:hypothetical protein CJF32_00007439 [Rutstroemia sp. NJR-2017a WRK4]|nr:hypothetical protein CJF32_00007439 [Rutstroemia sp. NJR-2017a WRK4]